MKRDAVKVTIAFDVDGTLDTSAGPVTVSRLRDLQDVGIHVAIVSPSGARPSGFPEHVDGSTRADNLRQVADDAPADLYLYVSDNQDHAEARAAGFTYIEATQFI